MTRTDEFPDIYLQLKGLFEPFLEDLVVKADTPDSFSLDTPGSAKDPQGTFFGAVRIGKSYVSYHLMPLDAFPDLLDGLSESLRRRMQGKSGFNFTSLGQVPVDELTSLTAAAFARVRQG